MVPLQGVLLHHPLGFKDGTPTWRCWFLLVLFQGAPTLLEIWEFSSAYFFQSQGFQWLGNCHKLTRISPKTKTRLPEWKLSTRKLVSQWSGLTHKKCSSFLKRILSYTSPLQNKSLKWDVSDFLAFVFYKRFKWCLCGVDMNIANPDGVFLKEFLSRSCQLEVGW